MQLFLSSAPLLPAAVGIFVFVLAIVLVVFPSGAQRPADRLAGYTSKLPGSPGVIVDTHGARQRLLGHALRPSKVRAVQRKIRGGADCFSARRDIRCRHGKRNFGQHQSPAQSRLLL